MSPGLHPRGKSRGLAGGVSRLTTNGEVGGSDWGGSPGPHPRGKLKGLTRGVSRSTTGGGGSWGVWPGGSPGPHPGGWIPACMRQTPQQRATAVGRTHPTGMHSCSYESLVHLVHYLEVSVYEVSA